MELLGLVVHLYGEVHHVFAVGNAEGRVAVHHEKIPVAGLVADGFQQCADGFGIAGIGVDKDRVVVVSLGGHDKAVGDVVQMQSPLGSGHLIPLAVMAMLGVDLAKGLHRQL